MSYCKPLLFHTIGYSLQKLATELYVATKNYCIAIFIPLFDLSPLVRCIPVILHTLWEHTVQLCRYIFSCCHATLVVIILRAMIINMMRHHVYDYRP